MNIVVIDSLKSAIKSALVEAWIEVESIKEEKRQEEVTSSTSMFLNELEAGGKSSIGRIVFK